MQLREGLEIGARGRLFIGGCDTVALANEFSTPLYAFDENYLRSICRAFVRAMDDYAPGGMVCYASKAFSCTAMCRIADQEKLGLDVVSGGELYTALQAGFPMERVTLHGSCKTPAELSMAVDLGVGLIVIDHQDEIPLLNEIAGRLGKHVRVGIRLNPDVAVDTHRAVVTATKDVKFGLGIEDGEALSAVRRIAMCEHLSLAAVHTHLGSQIFALAPYQKAVDRLTDFMVLAAAVTGVSAETLIIGGGFGVRYTDDDPPTVDPREAIRVIAEALDHQSARKGLPKPRLVVEPGRAIVAESAIALYTVGAVKRIPGVRNYVLIDGGMMDNPRPALYGAKYRALLAGRAADKPTGHFAIAGRACETGDVFGLEFPLPEPEIGETLAMLTAGAYQFSMASHYNRVPNPAVVLCRYGKAERIIERETYEELTARDRLPVWLR